jgi:hypothetical protein
MRRRYATRNITPRRACTFRVAAINVTETGRSPSSCGLDLLSRSDPVNVAVGDNPRSGGQTFASRQRRFIRNTIHQSSLRDGPVIQHTVGYHSRPITLQSRSDLVNVAVGDNPRSGGQTFASRQRRFIRNTIHQSSLRDGPWIVPFRGLPPTATMRRRYAT